MTTPSYQICLRCVMDTSDPTIQFDTNGVCNHCAAYEKAFASRTYFGVRQTESLDEVIAGVKKAGQGKRYDCVIGLSGGVDSTYVAYLVKSHGLRPLAVHVDNGWNSELAVSNIENVCKVLGIDLKTSVLNWNEFRSLQLSFLKASTPDAEIPSDHAIVATLYHTSRAMRIPVVAGYNARTESHMPAAWSQGHYDSRYIKAIQKKFGEMPLRTFPMMNWWESQRFVKGLINILNCIDYNKGAAIRIATDELGWRNYGKKHSESLYTKFYQEYYLPRKFGYDKRRSHLSSLINAGETTRDAALEELKSPPCSAEEGRAMQEYVVKKLQITPAQYVEIEKSLPRRFEDFESYARLQQTRSARIVRYVYHRTLKRWRAT